MAEDTQDMLLTLTADIVAAHVSNNSVGLADLPDLITRVHGALAGLGSPIVEPVEEQKPAVSAPLPLGAATAARGFFPLSASPTFLAEQKSRAAPSSSFACGPSAAATAAPVMSQAIEAMKGMVSEQGKRISTWLPSALSRSPPTANSSATL